MEDIYCIESFPVASYVAFLLPPVNIDDDYWGIYYVITDNGFFAFGWEKSNLYKIGSDDSDFFLYSEPRNFSLSREKPYSTLPLSGSDPF